MHGALSSGMSLGGGGDPPGGGRWSRRREETRAERELRDAEEAYRDHLAIRERERRKENGDGDEEEEEEYEGKGKGKEGSETEVDRRLHAETRRARDRVMLARGESGGLSSYDDPGPEKLPDHIKNVGGYFYYNDEAYPTGDPRFPMAIILSRLSTILARSSKRL